MKNSPVKKNKIFRSVDFWKSALITMPDNSFFELMRSVFGKIKTPFKKQQLINDLETFLSREDIQKTIRAYINDTDVKIITAVALLGEPVQGELESFFSGEFNSAQLQDIVVNLEERFILYRFIEEKSNRIALNPVLEKELLPFTVSSSALFPGLNLNSQTTKTSSAPLPKTTVLNDRILAAILSFVYREDPFFRVEGVIRKRVIDAGKTCFPGMNLSLVICSLQVLGLFYANGEKLIPDKKRFDDFGELSPMERMEYCAAALIVFNESKSPYNILPPLYRSRIREIANFIHSILSSLEPGISFQKISLKRLIEVFKTKIDIKIDSNLLFESLEKTELIAFSESDDSVVILPNIEQCDTSGAKNNGICIGIDSGSSIFVYPEITYADVISLASMFCIREAGAGSGGSQIVRYEIDKDTAVKAFDKNITADEMIDLLNRLSGGKADDGMIWTLKDWEKRHKEVSLQKGVILKLSENQRYLTETKPLAHLILETLSPGLYLLDENKTEEAAAALRKAGIDIIAFPSSSKTASGEAGSGGIGIYGTMTFGGTFPSLDAGSKNDILPSAGKIPAAEVSEKSQSSILTDNFHVILKKIQMGESERAELSARIDRRLILCEAQLKDANIRFEKLEARNMDYAGKQNIARQAITQQSPVEIVWSGKEGRIFGIPKTLEKEGTGLNLVIELSGDSENKAGDSLRIPLGKISLIRRIKKSIFA